MRTSTPLNQARVSRVDSKCSYCCRKVCVYEMGNGNYNGSVNRNLDRRINHVILDFYVGFGPDHPINNDRIW